MEALRLNKLLASRGVASRRKCDELIKAGRISVNGAVVLSPGTRAVPGRDVVALDGLPVAETPLRVCLMLNKPRGRIVSASDLHGRPTVLELVPASFGRLFPVGRLDLDTEGLLVLTNDGSLAFGLTHPRVGVDKRYEVLVKETPADASMRELRDGVDIGESRRSSPAEVEYLGPKENGHLMKLCIREGRKRQVRRMCKAVGLTVLSLVRTGLGPLELGDLPVGSWRELTAEEMAALDLSSGDRAPGGGRPKM